MRAQSQFMQVSPSLWMRCCRAPLSSWISLPSACPSLSDPSAFCTRACKRQYTVAGLPCPSSP